MAASIVAGSTCANRERSSSASISCLTISAWPRASASCRSRDRALPVVVVLGREAQVFVPLLLESCDAGEPGTAGAPGMPGARAPRLRSAGTPHGIGTSAPARDPAAGPLVGTGSALMSCACPGNGRGVSGWTETGPRQPESSRESPIGGVCNGHASSRLPQRQYAGWSGLSGMVEHCLPHHVERRLGCPVADLVAVADQHVRRASRRSTADRRQAPPSRSTQSRPVCPACRQPGRRSPVDPDARLASDARGRAPAARRHGFTDGTLGLQIAMAHVEQRFLTRLS